MHKKVAPLMGCVDTIYSDINRGFKIHSGRF